MLIPNQAIKLTIDNLLVKCNKRNSNICEWRGSIRNWTDHECQHSLIGKDVIKKIPGVGSFPGIVRALNK
jgi:NAD-dependent SIR2 family protein deacetylase